MTSSTQQLLDILGIAESADSSSAVYDAEVVRHGLPIESFKRVASGELLSAIRCPNV